jgi:hypothetical protein
LRYETSGFCEDGSLQMRAGLKKGKEITYYKQLTRWKEKAKKKSPIINS